MGVFGRWLGGIKNDITSSSELDAFVRGGAGTWSGINVNPQNALTVSAVFACTRVIAEDIGKLPFVVYKQTGEKRGRFYESPFWKLLHDRPNPYQTSQQFREYMTACALLRGNGYALKNVVQGQVRELFPLSPDQVRVEQLPNYELVYHVRMANGQEETKTRKEIFHLPGLTIDGPIGISVLTYARQTIGNAMGASRHAGTFFGNGMKPAGVLTHPKTLSKDVQERLKAQLIQDHGGANSNGLLVLEDGMVFSPISISNSDSQFLESRTFELLEVCRWFRIKPHKIAELTRATFSNVENESREHVTDTLMPWAERWSAAVNQQVIVTNNVYAEILFDALLRGTTLERYQAYNLAAGGNAPWMTGNEVREHENLEPLEGLDEVAKPLNMGKATDQPTKTEEPAGGKASGN